MRNDDLLHREITEQILGGFFEVYNHLPSGLAERHYAAALELELRARGLRVEREVLVDIYYKGVLIGRDRLDMVVNDVVVVENKTLGRLQQSDRQQLFGYLRATRLEVGLVLNFGPRPQFERVVCSNSDENRTCPPQRRVADASRWLGQNPSQRRPPIG